MPIQSVAQSRFSSEPTKWGHLFLVASEGVYLPSSLTQRLGSGKTMVRSLKEISAPISGALYLAAPLFDKGWMLILVMICH